MTPSALCIVDMVAPTYQPSKAELEEDMRVRATFEEAVEALTRPVTVRYIPRRSRAPSEGVSALSYIIPQIRSAGEVKYYNKAQRRPSTLTGTENTLSPSTRIASAPE